MLAQSAENSATAIEARAVVKHFRDVRAVDGVELTIRRGECFGLLGPNGAGKTTTVEMLVGLSRPDAGDLLILGERWGAGHDDAIRQRLGIQLQESQLGDKLTIREVVRLFRSFYRDGHPPDTVIAWVDLEAKAKARIHTLSGGQRQRLALACALVGKPDILFLDEPTTGLDPQARIRIWEIVERFRDAGGTIVLTTHYMEEAARLCHRVAVMDAGRIIACDTPRRLIDALGIEQIIELHAQPTPQAEVLRNLRGVRSVATREGVCTLHVSDIATAMASLLDRLRADGIAIGQLVTHTPTLEDVFIQLTGKSLRDA